MTETAISLNNSIQSVQYTSSPAICGHK